jgi:putative ABC transport system permease protein
MVMGSIERLVLSLAVRCYDVQLFLFPKSFRECYGPEMRSAFDDLSRDTWRRAGVPALCGLSLRTVIDSITMAFHEHCLSWAERRMHRRADSGHGGFQRQEVHLLSGVVHDVRYAARGLRQQPGFTAAAALTLALGIGANTAIFSVVHGVLVRPLPYQQENALVVLSQRSGDESRGFSVWEMQQYRADENTFDAVVEYHSLNFNLLGRGEPEMVQSGVVSWQFFDVLGVKPVLGRVFTPEDDQPNADPVLVLSFDYWQRSFDGDPEVVGQTVRMNDRVHHIVGVLPPVPHYPRHNDVYMPTVACPFRSSTRWIDNASFRGLELFGRLRSDVTIDQAEVAVAGIGGRLRHQHPENFVTFHGDTVTATSLKEAMTLRARPTLLLLMGAVGFVLLIACANVAGLTAARQLGREREMAVRTAIGAGRARLARLLITEGVLIAILGGTLGIGLAWLGMDALVAFTRQFTPRADEVRIDGVVLAFTLAVSVLTGVGFGLLPVVSSRRSMAGALTGCGRHSVATSVNARVRTALSIAQLSVSFVLLVGAGLSARSFVTLATVESGVQESRVLNVMISLPFNFTGDVTAFYRELTARLRGVPGVLDAAIASAVPMSSDGYLAREAFEIDGRDDESTKRVADLRFVSPGYFNTVGQPLLAGRSFDDTDTRTSNLVIVVSESLARRHFGDENPIGKTLVFAGGERATIIGLVGDVRQLPDQGVIDEGYISIVQDPGGYRNVLIRTAGDPVLLVGIVGDEVHALQPDVPVIGARTLRELRSDAVASPRIMATLMAAFAGVALLITATGVAGVISFGVRHRRNEMGIRMALGARQGMVLWMMLRQGLLLILVGAFLGAVGALCMGTAMRPLVHGVQARDPVTFVTGLVLIAGVALIATYVPARRVTSIDPVEALRAG